MKVIRVLGIAGVVGEHMTPGSPVGEFISSYNPEAHEGRGYFETVADPTVALKFRDAREALDFYQQRSKLRPINDRGQPNRPLTALTVEVIDPRRV